MKFFIVCVFLMMMTQAGWSQDAVLNAVIEGNTHFAFDVYHQLKQRSGNFVYSPYSISSVFAMTLAGAKGDTANEMQEVLHYPGGTFPIMGQLNEWLTSQNQQDTTQLMLAQGVWIDKNVSVLFGFQQTLEQTFKAPLQTVNFQNEPVKAVQAINEWIRRQTKGYVSQLFTIRDVNKNTRMVLTSAIYMRGTWQQPFDPKETKKAPFYVGQNHQVQAFFIHQVADYKLLIDPDFHLISLPYHHSSLALFILVPHQDFDAFESRLNGANWKNWLTKMKMQRVDLELPKFRTEERLDLNSIMQKLGMVTAFSPQADFSNITGQKDLYISKALHKTVFRLDEDGTEAAAATGVAMNLKSVFNPNKPYHLLIDRPFIFAIVDQSTHSVLFLGRLMQP